MRIRNIIIGGAAAATLASACLLVPQASGSQSDDVDLAVAPSGEAALCDMELQREASGECVSRLQKALNDHGSAVPVTGYFGPLTEAAVRSHQRAGGLEEDGIVGPLTRESLQSAASLQETPAMPTPSQFVGPGRKKEWATPGVRESAGVNDCGAFAPGLVTPEQWMGPTRVSEDSTVQGQIVLNSWNAMCGMVTAEVELQTKKCRKYLFYTDCEWASLDQKEYFPPVNGKLTTDVLSGELRKGVHAYRLYVRISAPQLDKGAISEQYKEFRSEEVEFQGL